MKGLGSPPRWCWALVLPRWAPTIRCSSRRPGSPSGSARADVRIVDLSDAEDYRGPHPAPCTSTSAIRGGRRRRRVPRADGRGGPPPVRAARHTPDTTVVLYDDEGGLHAAWLFLVLTCSATRASRCWTAEPALARRRRRVDGGGAARSRVERHAPPRFDADRVRRRRVGARAPRRRDVALVDARTPTSSRARRARASRRATSPAR